MNQKFHPFHLYFLALIFFLPHLDAKPDPSDSARRIEVLFLGSPNGSHRPLDRFKTIRQAHGVKGINYTYAHQPTALTKENLVKYDALLVYGNHDEINEEQETALLEYSHNGGACVFLHSACGCFRNSEKFIALLGAQFKSHGKGVFRTKIVNPDHPVMKGFPGFECWDESYVHQKHNQDRVVLQKREDEPWTWVRTNGKGRIFYTASGHDDRCWSLSEYQDLIYRSIIWTIGDKKAQLISKLKLPELQYTEPKVNIIQGKNWPDKPRDRGVPATHLQQPLSVKDSIKLVQVPVEMAIQVFASEPMIVNPIAINWDNKGRLWAVEAYDYPNSHVTNSPGKDRIKMLTDTNGDGKADTVSVFAEGLTIATSVLPIDKGCITTDGEEMVYLEDSNNDGKSDKRHVIFKGINLYDTHACVSNLHLGMDGWIYATVGYSGVKTTVAGKDYRINQGVFRFKRDGSDFEPIQSTSNNTWGLGFTEQGRILGSTANMNPSFYVGIPKKHYTGTDLKPRKAPRSDNKDRIFPTTIDFLQVDWKDHFTAAAGHSIYTARLFDKSWWNRRAFICAPTAKLVSAPILNSVGSGFKITNTEQNIYASADAWSAPVAAEVGPDGALYIADWYNAIVQHNVYGANQKKGKGNAYISEFRDRKYGRIYRISPKGVKVQSNPKLATLEQQLDALNNDNMFWRIQAQETLRKSGKKAIAALRNLAKGDSYATLHAIHVLGQLGEDLTELEKMERKTAGVQAALLAYLPRDTKTGVGLLRKLPSKAEDTLANLLYISELERSPAIAKAIVTLKSENVEFFKNDDLLNRALELALSHHGNLTALAAVATPRVPLSTSAKRGEAIYKAGCIACHQPDGAGSEGVFPPLAGSDWLARNPKHAIMVVAKGLSGEITVSGKKFNGAMPGHPQLSDQEVADVINFTRNNFTPQLGDISRDLVTEVRKKYKDHATFFTEADILKEK
ncbi:PVC-type heme-binding CxxCH protein [Rubritalea profundi]|uniref:Cytochrome c domain-containing protein n=1 Tax=Rubritalea profundi TaxID=1658618 RepID=A0A2S7U2A6_9BACT|nr:PVC-type heme-binding CxxCH protein [Rubritalea profundi]PQJ28657.1 hypothetical protein BSZ32_09180 [Rubritalea profundi]